MELFNDFGCIWVQFNSIFPCVSFCVVAFPSDLVLDWALCPSAEFACYNIINFIFFMLIHKVRLRRRMSGTVFLSLVVRTE